MVVVATETGYRLESCEHCRTNDTVPAEPHHLANIDKCIPILETTGTRDSALEKEVARDEYRFFHFMVDSFDSLNYELGAKIKIVASPCMGSVQLFSKPLMNYQGRALHQLFETVPNSTGIRSPTWPFPDKNTGVHPQGPDAFLVEPGVDYPGFMFQEQVWGMNAVLDGMENIASTKMLHGAYLISVRGVGELSHFRLTVFAEEDIPEADGTGLHFCSESPNTLCTTDDECTTKNSRCLPEVWIKQYKDAKLLDVERAFRFKYMEKKDERTDRLKSLETTDIPVTHGEYLQLSWKTPLPRLVRAPGDASKWFDLHSFDEYQVYWATDSRTFFDFNQPNEEGWGFLDLDAPARNLELERSAGFCYWNESGYPANATDKPEDAEAKINTQCIMDTECGMVRNGVPYYTKIKRNFEAPGLGLWREICEYGTNAQGAETVSCALSTEMPDESTRQFVRYRLYNNRHGIGQALSMECKRGSWSHTMNPAPTPTDPSLMCQPGLKCVYSPLDDLSRCEYDWFRPDRADVTRTQVFIRTKAPHQCWKTGEHFCAAGTKLIRAPTVDRRVELKLVKIREEVAGRHLAIVRFRVPALEAETGTLLYRSMEDAFTAVFKAHGLAGPSVDGVSDSDVLVMQGRSVVEVTTPVTGMSAGDLYQLPLPMPCSEPFVCTMAHWRSRKIQANIVRHKCLSIHKVNEEFVTSNGNIITNDVLKCKRFHPVTEIFAGASGNTTYDKATQAVKDDTIRNIALGIVGFFCCLIGLIIYLKVKSARRLKKAYQHVDKKLADMPPSIDKRRAKGYIKERKKDEKAAKKQAKLWDMKGKLVQKKITKKKTDFAKRMATIRAENLRRAAALAKKLKVDEKIKKRVQKKEKKIIAAAAKLKEKQLKLERKRNKKLVKKRRAEAKQAAAERRRKAEGAKKLERMRARSKSPGR